MMKKIIGFIIFTLLITTSGFSVVGINDKVNRSYEENALSFLNNPKSNNQIDEWPMFHHDLNNTGYSTSPAPDNNNILWSKDIAYDLKSNPTIMDDKLYIVANTLEPFGRGGDVYCLDPFTGEEIWKADQWDDEVWASPAVANSRVYVLGIAYKLYCDDAYTGELLWDFQACGHCSPKVSDDKVYFGSYFYDEGFYCLDATTGEEIWTHDSITSYDGCTPAIVNGMVYIASNEGILYCLDAETGYEIWNSSNKCYWASPAVINGKVYTNYDKVYCLDADNGDELWSYPIGDHHSSPAVAYGYVFVPDDDGRVYALDSDTGDLIWKSLTLGESIFNDAAVADGKLYICSNNPGKFNCLDAFTGELLWDYLFDSTHSYSSPAVAYGNVYVGSTGDGYLYAFGTPNEPPATPLKPDGPDNGLPYVEYMFNSSTTDSEGDEIYYLFDWGDGNYSDWIGPYASGEECSASHMWTEIGVYDIRVRAHDGKRKGNWSEPLTFYATSLPPDAPSIDGPTSGKKGVSYNFTFNSIDPEGEDVYYFIKWGDGCTEDWNGPHASGVDFVIAHSFPTSKTFIIEAKAKDTTNAESDWAEFTIIIPRDKAINNPILNFLQGHPNWFPLLKKLIQQMGFGL